MLTQLSLALVREPLDYKRALLLAEAAHSDGRVDDAETLVSIVYELMDAREWPLLREENDAADNPPQVMEAARLFSRH